MMEYIDHLYTEALRELCQSEKNATFADDAARRKEEAILKLNTVLFNVLSLAPIIRLATSEYERSLSEAQQQLIRDERTYFGPMLQKYHCCLLACILSDEGIEARTAKSIAEQIVYNRREILKYYNRSMQDALPAVQV